MAIINVTPDSFSGDGNMAVESAVTHALQAIKEGAGVLDIGAESTRPNATPINVDTEIARLEPVLDALKGRVSVPISIDTTKAEVAKMALKHGVSIINDISGGRADPAMLPLLASATCQVLLMHNAAFGEVRDTGHGLAYSAPIPDGDDYITHLCQEMRSLAENVVRAGITPNRLMLDPGLGFGKTLKQNLQILRELPQLAALGFPLVIGASRKSFIGEVLAAPIEERLFGSIAAAVLAAQTAGLFAVRVHDVRPTADALAVVRAMRGVD
jgi:dihydropteroate synthase